jgi:hypothetical protein
MDAAGDALGPGPTALCVRQTLIPPCWWLAGRFHTPTLAVLGGEDANVPQQITMGLHSWARVMVIPGHGHGVGTCVPVLDPVECFLPEMRRFVGHCILPRASVSCQA